MNAMDDCMSVFPVPCRTWYHSTRCCCRCRDVFVAVLSAVRKCLLSSKEYKSMHDRWRTEREWFADLKRHEDQCFPSGLARRLFVAADRLDELNEICALSREAMTYAQFYDSLFEVVDMWCKSVEPSEYLDMSQRLYRVVKRELSEADLKMIDISMRRRNRPNSSSVSRGFGSSTPAHNSTASARSPSPSGRPGSSASGNGRTSPQPVKRQTSTSK